MNPDFPQTPRDALEARLTAHLLGELGPDEAAAVARALAQDPHLARLHERLKQTIALVRQAAPGFGSEEAGAPAATPLQLSAERREQLLAHFKTVAPPELAGATRRPTRWYVPLALAALLMALAILAGLLPEWQPRMASSRLEARSGAEGRMTALPSAAGSVHSVRVIEPRYVTPDLPEDVGQPVATDQFFAQASQPPGESAVRSFAEGWARDSSEWRVESDNKGEVAFHGGRAGGGGGAGGFGGGGFVGDDSTPPASGPALALRGRQGGVEVGGGRAASSTRLTEQSANERLSGMKDAKDGAWYAFAPPLPPPPVDVLRFHQATPADGGRSSRMAPETQRGGAVAGTTVTTRSDEADHEWNARWREKADDYLAKTPAKPSTEIVSLGPGPETAAPEPGQWLAPVQLFRRTDANADGTAWGYVQTFSDRSARPSSSIALPADRISSAPTVTTLSGRTSSSIALPAGSAGAGEKQAQGASGPRGPDEVAKERAGRVPRLGDVPVAGDLFKDAPLVASRDRITLPETPPVLPPSAAAPVPPSAPGQDALGTIGQTDGFFIVNGVVTEGASRLRAPPGPRGEPSVRLGLDLAESRDLREGQVRKRLESVSGFAFSETEEGEKLNQSELAARLRGADVEDVLSFGLTTNTYFKHGAVEDFKKLHLGAEYERLAADGRKLVLGDRELRREVAQDKAESAAATEEYSRRSGKSSAIVLPSTALPESRERLRGLEAGLELLEGMEERKSESVAGKLPATTTPADAPAVTGLAAERVRHQKAAEEPAVTRRPAPVPEPQPEVQTAENPFSTFSLNVSDVSFKLAAASLEKGASPDPATVRSEEFINAFNYRDPEPAPGVPIAFAWDRARHPFAHNRDLLRFSIRTAALGREPGRPLNLVVLLDNSGSMERADRVRIIRECLRVLASQLQPQDKLSVVTFARTPRLWVDGLPGSQAGEVADQVGQLAPQGGTNLEEALRTAYETARRHYLAQGVNRVVLLTDGAANLGNVDPETLQQEVQTHRQQGVALDCFGIGWEGYNDDLLEVLSRHGDGRYGFVNSPAEAAAGFAAQLAGALRVAAADVKVQVEFNPRRVTSYRQIGYAKHQLTKEQFRDNTVDAAEIGAAETGNALYVTQLNPRGEGPIGVVRVRYRVPATGEHHEHEWAVPYAGVALPLEQAGPALRLAAVAAAFSEWLVSSPYAAEVTSDRLLAYLAGVPEVFGADPRPKQLEWMIRQAKAIGGR